MTDLTGDLPNLIVYGGSFDPPHQGHIDCVGQVLRTYPDAKVMVIPALIPAGAGNNHKHPIASFEQRLKMCQIAFGLEQWESRVTVSALESELPTPNYSLQTMRALREQHPGSRLALLMGQDQFKSFASWHEPKEILAIADIIVVRRDTIERGFGGSMSLDAKVMANALGLTLQWDDRYESAQVAGTPNQIFLLNDQISLAESTMIRGFIDTNRPLPDSWVPDNVRNFIDDHELYSGQGQNL